jgi:hypothetical protein
MISFIISISLREKMGWRGAILASLRFSLQFPFHFDDNVLRFLFSKKFSPPDKEKNFVFINSGKKSKGKLFSSSFYIITQGVKNV